MYREVLDILITNKYLDGCPLYQIKIFYIEESAAKDHLNLVCSAYRTRRVARWWVLVPEESVRASRQDHTSKGRRYTRSTIPCKSTFASTQEEEVSAPDARSATITPYRWTRYRCDRQPEERDLSRRSTCRPSRTFLRRERARRACIRGKRRRVRR